MNKNIKNRVVVTGMGIISCAGKTVNDFWASLVKGKSGIDYLKQVNTEGYSCKIGGEVDNFDPLNYMDKKEIKRLARYSQFAIAASMEAVASSEIDFNKEENDDIGVLLGSGSGGLPETEKENFQMFKNNKNTISPLYVPKILPTTGLTTFNEIGRASCRERV